MAQYEWSEIFFSLEGEAQYTGWPTMYIRFAGCNFTCKGFNNPERLDTTTIEALGFDPRDYSHLKDMPLITKGCDSQYSYNAKLFKHLWQRGDENKLAQEVVNLLPYGWVHSKSNLPVILSLTGGEPTLRQKTIPALINHHLFKDMQYLLFETNCSIPLRADFIKALNEWGWNKWYRKVIWSNSPKLSVSGEDWSKAIRPEIAVSQYEVENCEQYFKFVVDASERDFDEVEKAMNEYYAAGVPKSDVRVYCMPVACTSFQQEEIAAKVASLCMERGYIFCIRLQNILWSNQVGT
ncbi:MAG: hypothetical protein ACREAU_01220 [Nitrosopumilaceae archaeon]